MEFGEKVPNDDNLDDVIITYQNQKKEKNFFACPKKQIKHMNERKKIHTIIHFQSFLKASC